MSDRATSSTVRDRLALALDLPSLDEAEALARRLEPWFGVAKVGLELYVAEGPDAVEALRALGFSVFADLKLHDIPTTVERAARAAGRLGVRYLNVHAAGGLDMVRAGVAGLREGAAEVGAPTPVALAVTVLTSDPDARAFDERLEVARAAGCDGVVCSAFEVERARAGERPMVTVVPGTRPAGTARDDQARVASPTDAVLAGADILVVGRAVTRAADPEAAAAAFAEEVERALVARRAPG